MPSGSCGDRLPSKRGGDLAIIPPLPLPGRSAACDAMFAAGRRRRGHLHGLKAKRLRPSVLFLAGSSAQHSSAPPAGRAGRQAREDRAGRAGGRTGHRRREATAAGLQSAAAPGPRPGSCEAERGRQRQREAGSGLRRPPLRPLLTSGCRLAAWLLPRRSRGAPGPCRWPVPGWSWERFSLPPSPPSLSSPSLRLRSGSR